MNNTNLSISSPFGSLPPSPNCACPLITSPELSCWTFRSKIATATIAGATFGVSIIITALLIKKYACITVRLRKISGRFMALDPIPENNAV